MFLFNFKRPNYRDVTIISLVLFTLFSGGCNMCSKKDSKSAIDGTYCKKFVGDKTAYETCIEAHKEVAEQLCAGNIAALDDGAFDEQKKKELCGDGEEQESGE